MRAGRLADVGLGRYVLIVLAASCTANDDVPAPMISTVNPDHAQSGVAVTIIGDYFCQQPDKGGEVDPLACANVGSVNFGSTPASVGMYTEQMITAEVPSLGPGRASVTVAVAGRRSNSVTFVVDSP